MVPPYGEPVDVPQVSALVNAVFLAAYPFWSAIMIALDVLVIWAVTVHGREVRAQDQRYAR